MQIQSLLEELSQLRSFTNTPSSVQVVQTHLSVVFLVDEFVYKIKKPLDVGFANFTSLESRRYFCEQEVLLNRRLAPSVYLGVVPITRTVDGLRFEGEGEPIEWAVKMKRLPDDACLQKRLLAGQVTTQQIVQLGQRVAEFHRNAPVAPADYQANLFDNVSRALAETLANSQPLVGVTVLPAIVERLRRCSEAELARIEPILRRRGVAGMVRDTHGDLRLDHVYLFPDQPPPHDLVAIDCIEFNERFRYADPIADVAFLVMDLLFHGRVDLARTLVTAYFQASSDEEGRNLLRFFTSYRALVRGMVEGITLEEPEVPEGEKPSLRAGARRHFLLALSLLDAMETTPCLVLIGGLPGSGKSTLAARLSETRRFAVLRSDVIRKQMISESAGRYTSAATEQTYGECLRRARDLIHEGRRVILDATFRHEVHRRLFLDAARKWGVPGLFLSCHASPATIEKRLAARRNDVSDADWKVYQQLVGEWEPVSSQTAECHCTIATDADVSEVLVMADRALVAELRRQTLRN